MSDPSSSQRERVRAVFDAWAEAGRRLAVPPDHDPDA